MAPRLRRLAGGAADRLGHRIVGAGPAGALVQRPRPASARRYPAAYARPLAVGLLALATLHCGGSPTTPPVTGLPPAGRPSLPPTYRPSGHMAAGDVAVRLFQWPWTAVAAECESHLGPAGYRAALVSPPQEHALLSGSPWWEHYQPVSYSIAHTNLGTGTEFTDMVQRCRAVGVDVYVDAVINHMTAGAGTGSNGTVYTKYEYPGLYTRSDFHPACTVNDYQSAANVQDCELLGLADLNTGLASVRAKIAGYLIALARLGVAGFRIDAAKHIQPVELDSILDIVADTLKAEGRPVPYYFGEVIDYGGEAVAASDYYGLAYASGGAADITEFRFHGVGDKFLGTGGQHLAQLDPNGPAGSQFSAAAWGLMPADKAVVFIENHDTQRSGGLWYHDGATYRLANVWMLAQPYGYPIIMSGYAFNRDTQAGRDAGPPATGGNGTVTCAASLETAHIGDWVCEHRDPMIAAMVGFRRVVAGAPIDHWWDDGSNAIAFSRGNRGFVAISREDTAVGAAVLTGMAPGSYCDVLNGSDQLSAISDQQSAVSDQQSAVSDQQSAVRGQLSAISYQQSAVRGQLSAISYQQSAVRGQRSGSACAGSTIVVDSSGVVQLSLGANSAIAIDVATRQ